MAIKILTFLPVLIGLIVLYNYLQPVSEEPSYSEVPSEEKKEPEKDNDSGSSTELKTLMGDSR